MIRVAAVGDMHAGIDSAGRPSAKYAWVAEQADVLLLAGDLTRCGARAEATVLAAELRGVGVPVIAVPGHVHGGTERGIAPGRVRVRNVALPVLRQSYAVYPLGEAEADARVPVAAARTVAGVGR